MLQPRNLIIVDENSLQIIERHQNLNENEVLTNSVTEIFVNPKSIVDYYKIQNDNLTSSLIDNTYISQEKKSIAKVHTFSFGGKLTRNNLNYFQKGSYIDSIMKGITILKGKQHVDHCTLVHHAQPNCESHQDYKGIFSERSEGVFNGQILVDKIAQKTNAFQQNNNILLDDKASVNTKPQLEIYADDVKCSHGSTSGNLDENALFYLKSRGIPEKEAKALLMYGFANNVMQSVRIPELKNRITNLIANKFISIDLGFKNGIYDVNKIREDFPILKRKVNGQNLIYFDNAATTQVRDEVILIVSYYSNYNSNIHRGVHALSQEATDAYEGSRVKFQKHFNAKNSFEIIFTSGTTLSEN